MSSDNWKIVAVDHLKIRHPNGKFYGALYFSPFTGHTPEQVQAVEVLESWRGGGCATILWIDGQEEQVIFGRRKPGTVGQLLRLPGGFNSFRNRNRRLGRIEKET